MRVTVYLPPYLVGLKLRLLLAYARWNVVSGAVHIALDGRICCTEVSRDAGSSMDGIWPHIEQEGQL
jgi:hypothetical protein